MLQVRCFAFIGTRKECLALTIFTVMHLKHTKIERREFHRGQSAKGNIKREKVKQKKKKYRKKTKSKRTHRKQNKEES